MSCSADSGEPAEVYEGSYRKARRERSCDACGNTIRKGDTYHNTRMLVNGYWSGTDRCARCQIMYDAIDAHLPDGEFCAEELDCGHDWEEVHGYAPNDRMSALAFMSPEEAQSALAEWRAGEASRRFLKKSHRGLTSRKGWWNQNWHYPSKSNGHYWDKVDFWPVRSE